MDGTVVHQAGEKFFLGCQAQSGKSMSILSGKSVCDSNTGNTPSGAFLLEPASLSSSLHILVILPHHTSMKHLFVPRACVLHVGQACMLMGDVAILA